MSDKILYLPYRGAAMTVAAISRVVIKSQNFYSVRQVVEQICANIPSKDYLSEMLAILRWVEQNTRYMRDPRTVELVRAPYLIVAEVQAGKTPGLDCDDITALIATMCMIAGHSTRVVIVAFKNIFYQGKRQYTHVFAQAQEPTSGKWIALDPVPGVGKTGNMLRTVIATKIYPLA